MSSSYEKVRGGSLSFKNGGTLGVKKKKKKKDKAAAKAAAEAAAADEGGGERIGGEVGGDAKSDYEELFPYEKKRQAEGKGRANCWGTNYREAPEILHGYTTSWKGKKASEMSAEERLDLRAREQGGQVREIGVGAEGRAPRVIFARTPSSRRIIHTPRSETIAIFTSVLLRERSSDDAADAHLRGAGNFCRPRRGVPPGGRPSPPLT